MIFWKFAFFNFYINKNRLKILYANITNKLNEKTIEKMRKSEKNDKKRKTKKMIFLELLKCY